MPYLVQSFVGRVVALEVNLSNRDSVILCPSRLGVKG